MRDDPPMREGWKIVARFSDGSPFIVDECGRLVDTGCVITGDKHNHHRRPQCHRRPQRFHGTVFWDEEGR